MVFRYRDTAELLGEVLLSHQSDSRMWQRGWRRDDRSHRSQRCTLDWRDTTAQRFLRLGKHLEIVRQSTASPEARPTSTRACRLTDTSPRILPRCHASIPSTYIRAISSYSCGHRPHTHRESSNEKLSSLSNLRHLDRRRRFAGENSMRYSYPLRRPFSFGVAERSRDGAFKQQGALCVNLTNPVRY